MMFRNLLGLLLSAILTLISNIDRFLQILIDAKSLLGVIGIGTNNDFKVCYMGDDQAFDNVVDKFTVA